MFNISEDTRVNIYKFYNKNKSDVETHVNIILEWLKTQPHLPEILNEAHITWFLVLNQFSIEKTKQKIDNYYTIRSKIPDVYTKCNPKLPHLQHFRQTCIYTPLPNLKDGLYRVVFLKILTKTISLLDLYKYINNVFEIRLHEECAVGDICVNDFGNLSIEMIKSAAPSMIAKGFSIGQNVFSMRTKAIYYINCPPIITTVLAIIKPMVKPKIFERMHVFKDDSILKEILSEDNLPKDYGGKGPSLIELNEMLQQKFVEYEDRFDQMDRFRVDENLRPEKLVNDDLLGFYGNFKKLDVD